MLVDLDTRTTDCYRKDSVVCGFCTLLPME